MTDILSHAIALLICQKMMLCLEHPTAYPAWWAKLETLLRARQVDGPGNIYPYLLEVCVFARDTKSDEDVLARLMAIPLHTGLNDEIVSHSLVKCIVAMVFNDQLV